ncbi:unnamed protein product [Linum tenue]|uniref:OVATE domain-containing protein n=2 Tax=Linum tenue TaxID=586396 RepID=A0AAV0S6E3_9ROSI|nr:unnamed protein product [Linum tenue]
MTQMVVEKGIYSQSGLEEQLKQFLELNSPCYHAIFVRAFTSIWNEVVVAAAGVGRQHDIIWRDINHIIYFYNLIILLNK